MTSERGAQPSAASQSSAGRLVVGCLAALALLLGAAALVVGALLALRFGAPAWAVALGGIALLVAGFIWLQRSAARNR